MVSRARFAFVLMAACATWAQPDAVSLDAAIARAAHAEKQLEAAVSAADGLAERARELEARLVAATARAGELGASPLCVTVAVSGGALRALATLLALLVAAGAWCASAAAASAQRARAARAAREADGAAPRGGEPAAAEEPASVVEALVEGLCARVVAPAIAATTRDARVQQTVIAFTRAMMADEQIATALATNIGNTNKAVVRDAASLAFSYLPFGQRSNPEPEDEALPSSAATGSSGPPPRTPLTGGRGV